MDCERIEEKLVEYLDGTLSIHDKEQVKSHMEGCARCENQRALWVEFLTDIKHQEARDPGVAFWQEFTARVKHSIEQEQNAIIRKKSNAAAWWKIDFFVPTFRWAAACAVVVVAFGLFLFSKNNGEQHDPALSPLQQIVRQADLSDQEGADVFFDLIDDEGDDNSVDFIILADEV